MDRQRYLESIRRQCPAAAIRLQSSVAQESGVYVTPAIMYLAEGRGNDALVIAYLHYWSKFDKQHQPRMKYERDGHLWVVDTHEEIAKRIGFTSHETVKNILERLAKPERQIIIRDYFQSPFHRSENHGRSRVTAVRLNWPKVEELMDE